MIINKITGLLFVMLTPFFWAQKPDSEYHFKTIVEIPHSAIKNQGKTGTCWAFSSDSFIENEVFSQTKKWYDLSEMYLVRKMYQEKAFNYLYRQGKAQFGEGGLAHDVLAAFDKYGIVPESVFNQTAAFNKDFNHTGLENKIKQLLDDCIANPKEKTAATTLQAVEKILDETIGKDLTEFTYNGVKYTPKKFSKTLNFKPTDYISVTSFQFAPFYQNVILPIPDNYHNGQFYNVPLEEMILMINTALFKNQTVILDIDISEPTFSATYGLAIMPEKEATTDPNYQENLFKVLYHEPLISQEIRERDFLNFETTDDHLMHIVGLVKDATGNQYYKVKNSWGISVNDGYVYISAQYLRFKTISITLKKSIVSNISSKK